jgi:chromosome partitioning protein
MGKITAVTNQKGGVGKTTASFHLVHAASEILLEAQSSDMVLAIDLCGQGNLSQFLTANLEINKNPGGAEKLFEDRTDGEELPYMDTLLPNVKLLHGHRDLPLLDTDETLERAVELRETIRSLPFKYIIIDTPPALGPRIAAPMLWADTAFIVVEAHLSSVIGLGDTFDTVDLVKGINTDLDVKMILNRYVKAATFSKQFRTALMERFGPMFVEEFALRTAVSDACQNYRPVWKHAKDKALKEQWRHFSMQAIG